MLARGRMYRGRFHVFWRCLRSTVPMYALKRGKGLHSHGKFHVEEKR